MNFAVAKRYVFAFGKSDGQYLSKSWFIATEILVSDVRLEREDERSVFSYVTESESRSIGRKRPRFC